MKSVDFKLITMFLIILLTVTFCGHINEKSSKNNSAVDSNSTTIRSKLNYITLTLEKMRYRGKFMENPEDSSLVATDTLPNWFFNCQLSKKFLQYTDNLGESHRSLPIKREKWPIWTFNGTNLGKSNYPFSEYEFTDTIDIIYWESQNNSYKSIGIFHPITKGKVAPYYMLLDFEYIYRIKTNENELLFLNNMFL